MALTFKAGVKLRNLQPQMLIAIKVAEQEFSKYNLDTVVTSGNDSEHSNGSKHYVGAALDFRTKHTAGLAKGITKAVSEILTPLGFDVILEDVGEANEHLHVEYDPK